LDGCKEPQYFKSLFRKLGLAVFPFRKGYVYIPKEIAIKAIKTEDLSGIEPFHSLAEEVIGHGRTKLAHDRLYNVYQAIWNVRQAIRSGASMAEVGVYRGGSSYFMAAAADRLLRAQPSIFSIDTFEGHAAQDLTAELDGPHQPGLFSDTSYAEVQRYLARFPNVHVYKGRFQDRVSELAGQSICFAHIDVDIYAATVACLDFFSEVLTKPGILLVDDYGFKTCEGAKRAVDEFAERRGDFLKVDLRTGQCLLARAL